MADKRSEATALGPGNLRERMLGGGLWVAGTQVVVQSAQFAITAVLAHLLLPSDYGLFGMCVVVTGLSAALNELGLTSAIVQTKDLNRPAEVSAFWVCMALSALIYAGIYMFAPVVATLFDAPQIIRLIRILAIALPVNAAATVAYGLLARRLDFKNQGLVEISRTTVYGLTAIPCAIAGMGVWSLIAGEIAGTTARAASIILLARWRPAFIFRPRAIKNLFKFGFNVTGAGFSMAARDNVDRFIIGRWLGAATLGGYSLALRLITAPQKRISMMIMGRVTFAGFSRIQDDRERIRAIYCRVIKLTALITFPALAWLAGAARPFIAVMFGANWLFIVTPVQILCVAGAFYSIFTPVRSVILGTGRAAWEFALLFFSFLLVALAVAVGARFGLLGIAVAFSLQAAVSYLIYQTVGHRIIKLEPRKFYPNLAVPVGVAAAVGVTTAAAAALAAPRYGAGAALALSLLVGGIVYLVALKVTGVAEVDLVANYLKGKGRQLFDQLKSKRSIVNGKGPEA